MPLFIPQTTIFDFWNQAYRRRKLGAASERTLEYYRQELRHVARLFKVMQAEQGKPKREPRLEDLNDDFLSDLMARRLNESAIATANKIHKVLCPIWRFAKREGLVETMPSVELFDTPKRVRSTPTPQRFTQILEACENAEGMVGKIPAKIFWPALIAMDVNTGVRVNALMSIRREDVDLENSRVLVRAESQKHRADQFFQLLPLTIELIEPLYAWRDELLFPWPWDKRPREWQTLRRHFKRILKAAGLPSGAEQMFHCFRRYTATRVSRQLGRRAAQEYLGHSDESVTARYIDPLQGVPTFSAEQAMPELMGSRRDRPDPQPPAPTPEPKPRRFDDDAPAIVRFPGPRLSSLRDATAAN